ncbi:MAG: hypothetical protein JW704_02840, partial [Anaerolineaceae bacterium]|nr:hypothetical protein [Anaerolineaceae bacterium]
MDKQSRPGTSVKETMNGIKISNRRERIWRHFFLAVINLLTLMAAIILVISSIITLTVPGVASGVHKSTIYLLLVSALLIPGLYAGAKRVMDVAFLQEDIEITDSSITIIKTGFLIFKNKKVIPFENIEGIHPTIQLSADDSKLADVLMNTSNDGKITITTRQRITPLQTICRG